MPPRTPRWGEESDNDEDGGGLFGGWRAFKDTDDGGFHTSQEEWRATGSGSSYDPPPDRRGQRERAEREEEVTRQALEEEERRDRHTTPAPRRAEKVKPVPASAPAPAPAPVKCWEKYTQGLVTLPLFLQNIMPPPSADVLHPLVPGKIFPPEENKKSIMRKIYLCAEDLEEILTHLEARAAIFTAWWEEADKEQQRQPNVTAAIWAISEFVLVGSTVLDALCGHWPEALWKRKNALSQKLDRMVILEDDDFSEKPEVQPTQEEIWDFWCVPTIQATIPEVKPLKEAPSSSAPPPPSSEAAPAAWQTDEALCSSPHALGLLFAAATHLGDPFLVLWPERPAWAVTEIPWPVDKIPLHDAPTVYGGALYTHIGYQMGGLLKPLSAHDAVTAVRNIRCYAQTAAERKGALFPIPEPHEGETPLSYFKRLRVLRLALWNEGHTMEAGYFADKLHELAPVILNQGLSTGLLTVEDMAMLEGWHPNENWSPSAL